MVPGVGVEPTTRLRSFTASKAATFANFVIRACGAGDGNRTRIICLEGRYSTAKLHLHGSPSRIRTYDKSVNSRLLYQLSYWEIIPQRDDFPLRSSYLRPPLPLRPPHLPIVFTSARRRKKKSPSRFFRHRPLSGYRTRYSR